MRPEKGPQKTRVKGGSGAHHEIIACTILTLRVLCSRLLDTPSSLLSDNAEIVVASGVSWLQAIQVLEHIKLQRADIASMRERVATSGGRVGLVLVVTSRQSLRLGEKTCQAEQARLLSSDRPRE